MSRDLKTISVVLPCHNEVAAMTPVLTRLHEIAQAWGADGLVLREVVLVDDGSCDETRKTAEAWHSEQEALFALRVIAHERRKGYGAALKSGIAAASGDYIAFYDVDGTYDPAQIPSMIREIHSRSASMVCGDRLSQCEHMPLTREIGNRLFVGTINFLYRTQVLDSCTGMRVFSKEMREFFSSDALPDGLDYSLAMTLSFLRTGHRLVEVPIPYSRRIGRSKLRVLTDGPRFFSRILMSWVRTPEHVKVFRRTQKID